MPFSTAFCLRQRSEDVVFTRITQPADSFFEAYDGPSCGRSPLQDEPRPEHVFSRNQLELHQNQWEFREVVSSTTTQATKNQDGGRVSRRNLERNHRRRERRKAARALRRSPAKSPPIVVSPDVTPPAKTTPSPSTADGSGDTWVPASWGYRRSHHRPN